MIHLEQYGAGARPYVALHGWGGSHLTFAPLAPFVPQDARLYAADLPGYGRSPRPGTPSADEVAATLTSALDRVPGSELTLIGNCSGAIFALLVAALAGGRVARLVLIDPFAFVPWYFKVFINPTYGRYAYYSTFANPLGRWLTNTSLRSKRTASSDLTGSFREIDHEVSLAYLEMLDALGGVTRFSSIRTPTDIAYGERTFGAVKQSLDDWRRVLPHARLWRIDGAGHLPIEEAPELVASLVFDAPRASGRAA